MSNNSTINQLPLGIFNAMVPAEGPKIVPLTLDHTVAAALTIDLTQQQQSGKFSFIQSIMVDNSGNPNPYIITTNIIGQRLVIPANGQAILPIFIGNPPKFTCQTTIGVVIPLWVLNVPLPAQVWGPGSGGFTFTGAGYLQTSDVALDALIANGGLTVHDTNLEALIDGGGLNVNIISGGGGGGSPVNIIADSFNAGGASVHSASSGAGNKWHITGALIQMDANAAIAAGLETDLEITANGATGTTFLKTQIVIPAAALGYVQTFVDVQFASPIVTNDANVQVFVGVGGGGSPALTAGRIGINVWGFAAP